MRIRVVVVAFLCLLVSGLFGARAGYAQEQPTYTIVAMGTPLSEAFDRFIEQSGINVVFQIDLVESKSAWCRAVDLGEEAILKCLLKDTGLDYIRLSSGTYVLVEQARAPVQWGGITGRVVDVESGEPLPNAHVLLADAGIGEVTNDAGRFAFNRLKPGPHRLVVTYLGYRNGADTVTVAPEQRAMVEMKLQVAPLLTAPVVVNGISNRFASESLYAEESPVGDLERSGLQGDVIRSMNMIIGVRVGDVLADVHVQGGDNGEHQYRLDGAPVFVPVSSGGIFGPFSPFALDKLTIHKAGFSAAMGSHLSGVIEATHLLSPMAGSQVDVQVDPLSVNARALGSLGDVSRVGLNWMVAARKSMWGLVQPQGLQNHFDNWNATDLHVLNALFPTDNFEGKGQVLGSMGANVLQNVSREAREQIGGSGFDSNFDFHDLHGAFRLHMGPLRTLHGSFYRGGNSAGDNRIVRGSFLNPGVPGTVQTEYFDFQNGYKWQNTVAQLKFEHILGDRTFAEWSGWVSRFDGTQQFDHEKHKGSFREDHQDSTRQSSSGYYLPSDSIPALGLWYHDRNIMNEFGLRAEIDHAIGSRTFVTGGLEAIRDESEFNLNLQGARNDLRQMPNRAEVATAHTRLAAFLDNAITLTRSTSVDAGIRLTYLGTHGKVYAEPRVSIRHDAESGRFGPWAFRGALGLYRQYVNQFDITAVNRNALIPTMRFWLPLDGTRNPASAYHATASLLLMPKSGLEVRFEGYYKWQPHIYVIDYANPALFGNTASVLTAQDDLLHDAKGFSYGAALVVEKKTDVSSVKVQYEYSVAEQLVSNRFDGRYVGVPWNVPHRLIGSFTYRATDRITLLGRLENKIGQSWAFRGAYYNFLEPDPVMGKLASYDLSDPTAHRLPMVTYLDFGISFSQPLNNANLQVRLDLSNMLSFRNVEEWSLSYDPVRDAIFKVERPLTPFLPSLVVRLGF